MAMQVFVSGVSPKKADQFVGSGSGWGSGKGVIGSNGSPKYKGIRGIAFTGNHDGNVLVSYSAKCAIPLDYVESANPDGSIPADDEWIPIKNYGQASKRALNHEFVLAKFPKAIKEVVFNPPDAVETYDMEKSFLKDFPWMLNFKGKDARIEVDVMSSKPQLNFLGGTWKKGEFRGHIFSGEFDGGKFYGDLFMNGTFNFGVFITGTFKTSVWNDGIWDSTGSAVWENARWKKGKIKTFRDPGKISLVDPNTFMDQMDENAPELKAKKLMEDKFGYSSLSPDEQQDLYNTFATSYTKAVGAAWDQSEFEWKAKGWTFYGSTEGGVALRKQNSGGYKLNAVFGGPRASIEAFHEMMKDIGKESIWGFMTPSIGKMLVKLSKGEFKQLPPMVAKVLIPKVASAMGTDIKQVTNNGSVIVDTPAGPMEKVMYGNKNYFRWLLDMATDPANAGKLPVPQIVIKPMIALIRALI
jgi:hypothetical protein